MDMVNLIFCAENLRTLLLLFTWITGLLWLDRRLDKHLNDAINKFRQEVNAWKH